MKKLGTYYGLAALGLAALLLLCCLSSCCWIYEDFSECGDIDLTVINDWSEAPVARPDGMAYIFFAGDNQKWRFDFPGTEAGKVRLPQGSYSFVSYNDDSFRTIIDGDSYSSLVAYTLPVRLPADIPAAGTAVEAPDMLWGCSYYAVTLTYSGLTYFASADASEAVAPTSSPAKILTAKQRQITPRYRIRVEDVENLSNVRRMSAALSGMAGNYHLAAGRPDAVPATLCFDARGAGPATIACDLCTFGLTGRPDVPIVFYLFVTLTDGRAFVHSFDVTEQVRRAPDPMDVTIVLRGLVIEDTDPGIEGGFDVNVDGWTTVDVNITD